MFSKQRFHCQICRPPITADKPPIKLQKQAILDFINENGSINNAETCKILEVKPTRAKEILRGMVAEGEITPVGEKKSRRYIK